MSTLAKSLARRMSHNDGCANSLGLIYTCHRQRISYPNPNGSLTLTRNPNTSRRQKDLLPQPRDRCGRNEVPFLDGLDVPADSIICSFCERPPRCIRTCILASPAENGICSILNNSK